MAVADTFGDGDQVRGAGFSTDRESAFSFLPVARGEWYLQGFVWDANREDTTLAGSAGSAAWPTAGELWDMALASAAEASGPGLPLPQPGPDNTVFGWWVSMRSHFGGGHMPQRFGRFTRLETAVTRQRMRAFDAQHPWPACVQRAIARRRQAQEAGLLPPGDEQLVPADIQGYIDDHGGTGLTDITGIPRELAAIKLDVACMAIDGGVPVPMDCRVANYARIDVSVALELRLSISPKTQVGTRLVSLGSRLDVLADRQDCPPSKQRAVRALGQIVRSGVLSTTGLERKAAERLVGKLGNLSQVEPGLLLHLHAGYAVVKWAMARRRPPKFIHLREDGHRRQELLALIDTADALLEANEGVPLLVHSGLAREGELQVTIATDASRQGSEGAGPLDDGVGGWAFDPRSEDTVLLLSDPWPSWAREALAVSAARRVDRPVDPPTRLPMPAAELFGCWAMAHTVAEYLGSRPDLVVAVGDCRPAAIAITLVKSRSAVMRQLLAEWRAESSQVLGVWVPRELNTDADRLSHPSLRNAVEADARARGWKVVWLTIPEHCWQALMRAIQTQG
jgi:hypothetical protein